VKIYWNLLFNIDLNLVTSRQKECKAPGVLMRDFLGIRSIDYFPSLSKTFLLKVSLFHYRNPYICQNPVAFLFLPLDKNLPYNLIK
jgi:hypothetical protein